MNFFETDYFLFFPLIMLLSFIVSAFINSRIKRVKFLFDGFKTDPEKFLKMQSVLDANSKVVVPVVIGGTVFGMIIMTIGFTTKNTLFIEVLSWLRYLNYLIIGATLYDMKSEGAILSPVIVALLIIGHYRQPQSVSDSFIFLISSVLVVIWVVYRKFLKGPVF